MELAAFARLTERIIRDQGIADFLSIACYPDRQEIRGLADVPEHGDIQTMVLDWVRELARPDEEFLVAFKHSPLQYKVVRVIASDMKSEIFNIE